jgi:hypothetical protein
MGLNLKPYPEACFRGPNLGHVLVGIARDHPETFVCPGLSK